MAHLKEVSDKVSMEEVLTTDEGLELASRAPYTGIVDRLEPDIELASRESIAAAQESAVIELVQYAWNHSPLYRLLWSTAGVSPDEIRSIEDFTRKIPLLTKADIRAYRERTGDPYGGLLCVERHELTSVTTTSGTTSEPETLPEIWTQAPPLPAASLRDLYAHGLRPGDKVIVPVGTSRNYWDDFYLALGLTPVFVDSWLGQGEGLIRAIMQHKVAYMQVLPSAIVEFEKLAGEYDLRTAFRSVKFFSYAGQPLGAALKRKITEDWGVKVVSYTSAGDTGTAWEGPDLDGFQLWEDTVFPEVLDPVTGDPVNENEPGELVATDLDNRAAPYIRFRSGDLVRISREPTSAGTHHARMWVAGRMTDATIISGKPVAVSDVWQIVETLPELSEGMFQIVRTTEPMNRLRLRIGYAPERTADVSALERRVTDLLKSSLGVDVDVAMLTLEEILQYSSSTAKFPRTVEE